MSLDVGDVDNDGRAELFATDMKPYLKDVRTMATWMPMMQKMSHPKTSADPQITENVLQVADHRGRFRNEGNFLSRQLESFEITALHRVFLKTLGNPLIPAWLAL